MAEGGLRSEVREYGRIANTPAAVERLARKLSRDGVRLRFCCEAGPCGYGIQRQLSALGHECVVVAPSLIPKRAGDRVKTDRRDAASLARLHRAGELTALWVPDAKHEVMLLTADGKGTNAITQAVGKDKTVVWRWQERFMHEGIDGSTGDKTRPSRIPPLPTETVDRVSLR